MNVEKRNGIIVEYDRDKIINAIKMAMENVNKIDDNNISEVINKIESNPRFIHTNIIKIEDIQDMIEEFLMDIDKTTAKAYIIYRDRKSETRKIKYNQKDKSLLSDDFISKYKHIQPPMDNLGIFVYYRTYSRWLEKEKRREYWWETVRRAVEYNCSLVANTSIREAEYLYDNIFNLKQFLSGRTLWSGGTPVSIKYPMSNYNCSFTSINNFQSFSDIFYLLMIGSGAGISVLKEEVDKLPKIRNNYTFINEAVNTLPSEDRCDYTSLEINKDNIAKIIIGDSKEGWVESLTIFFKLLYSNSYRNIKTIIMNYDNIRPRGEKLKTFGGTASGFSSIKDMFTKINIVIHSTKYEGLFNLKPINCLDISNIIGENVVSGGVRRTSEIIIIDSDNEECLNAKKDLYIQENGKWSLNKSIEHRQMSNNSIMYKTKPSRDQFHKHILKVKQTGEPGWVNHEAASKRRENFKGVNPCGEILLDDNGLCNLVTNNVLGFVENGLLDKYKLYSAIKLSVRSGYRMTCPELELYNWDYIQQRDKLIGCSLTGWQDMINATNMTPNEEYILLGELNKIATEESNKYAKELELELPLLITTVKPEGTLSLLPGVSCGIHYSHSDYYIRRVRISADDTLVKVCEELDYPVLPEVGQTLENCKTKVIEFPCKAPSGKTKKDISAIDQLKNYLKFMKHYVDHNASVTITVKKNEWDEVEEFIYKEWDKIVAITLISDDDNFYELMPFEECTKEEYEHRNSKMKKFNPSLISKYEVIEEEFDIGESSCSNGVCGIR